MTDYSKLTDEEINERVFKNCNPAAYDCIQSCEPNNEPYYNYIGDDGFCFKIIVANEIVVQRTNNPPTLAQSWLAYLLPYHTQAFCETPQRAALECYLQIVEAEQAVD